MIRLRAENSALQTNIGEIRTKFENELKLLRSAVEGVDITDSASGYVVPYRMKIYAKFNLATWLKMAKFADLIISEFRLSKFIHIYIY